MSTTLERRTSERHTREIGRKAAVKALEDTSRALQVAAKRNKNRWSSKTEFVKAVVAAGGQPCVIDPRLKAPLGQHEDSGQQGGYLVPPRFAPGLISRRLNDPFSILDLCRRYLTTSNQITATGLDDADKSTAGKRYGGLVAYWIKPGVAMSTSALTLRQVNFTLADLCVLVPTTDRMVEDVENLGAIIGEAASYAIEDTVLEAVLFGDGIGEPLGAFNSPDVLTITPETGQGVEIVKQNLDKMWAALPLPLRSSAAWVVNPDVESELARCGDRAYLPAGSIPGVPYATLKGRPVVVTGHCPALGTPGDIALGGFGAYGLALKVGGVQRTISAHVEFKSLQQHLRYVLRVDGRSLWDTSSTPQKGSTERSPFVVLDERS